jgi:hypothetical protein
LASIAAARLDQLSALAQIVGAGAVLASLGFIE